MLRGAGLPIGKKERRLALRGAAPGGASNPPIEADADGNPAIDIGVDGCDASDGVDLENMD
jgi:hypothetical protein